MTVKVCPVTIAGVVMQVEPSKMAGSLEKPGHPTAVDLLVRSLWEADFKQKAAMR